MSEEQEALQHHVDRTGWYSGPWDSEPDRLEWRSGGGLPCLIVRSEGTGALCGYVGVPPGHPWHGQPCENVDARVHGGLTYGSACAGSICHVPLDGESGDVWWIGFDCAHAWDETPALFARHPSLRAVTSGSVVYRELAYVRGEVEDLAAQVLAAANGGG